MSTTKLCVECAQPFKLRLKIEGRWASLKSRTRCLICLPFKTKRTRVLSGLSQCSRCRQTKTSDEFYKRTKTQRPTSLCKLCYRTRYQEAYDAAKKHAVASKGGKCADCMRVLPDVVYDFHHLDPSAKERTWKEMRQMTQKKREVELAKCVLLCSNCHRVRHWRFRVLGEGLDRDRSPVD